MKLILFDMDGTLIDPKLGFVRCINYALKELTEKTLHESVLVNYIGPPLDYAFKKILGSYTEQLIEQCVAKFRERYVDVGWQENHLYSGIDSVLATLHDKNYELAICTSRRTDLALKIINHYGYDVLFKRIFGADVGIKKSQVIKNLMAQGSVHSDSWLIGDRSFDISAAKLNGLQSIAVLWGYGTKQELEECAPDYFVKQPAELLPILDKNF